MEKIPFTTHHIIGYLTPGSLYLLMVCCSYNNWDLKLILQFVKEFDNISIGVVTVLLAFFIGLIFDGIRNGVVEKILRNYCKAGTISESFFHKAPNEEVVLFYGNYYTYYVFDLNAITALVLSLITNFFMILNQTENNNWLFDVFVLCFSVILFCDARSLRKDIIEITSKH